MRFWNVLIFKISRISKMHWNFRYIVAYKSHCLIVLGMFAWHFISSWYGFVCLICLQQWLIRLNQFQFVLRNIFIFEIPKISITHWHCKLVNLPLILVNCNFWYKKIPVNMQLIRPNFSKGSRDFWYVKMILII